MKENQITIQQAEDQKIISLKTSEIEKVLSRVDYDGSQFIQINFQGQSKILITKNKN